MAFLGLKIVHQIYLAQNPERRLRGNLLTPITKDCAKELKKFKYMGQHNVSYQLHARCLQV